MIASPLTPAQRVFQLAWSEGFQPDPVLSVSEWANAHRMLSRVTSAEPANYSTERTPFWREPMDALSIYHPARRVVVVAGAQIGKTEMGLNWLGYVIHCAPGPTLMVQPRAEDAESVSKERVAPMIALTPVLRELVSENRSRDGDNTILTKMFRGGMLAITGANSAAGLRRRPVRNLFADEVDAYPEDVDGEGDPLELARKRMTTFLRIGKELVISTPTIKGRSRIEREFNESDQRHYFVPCPSCGAFDWLRWQSIDYRNNDPTTARWLCGSCGELIDERYKTQMLAAGEWRPGAESRSGALGYHLSGLYSPIGWLSWAQIVEEHLASERDASLRKTWVNTRLAETWEERNESVDPAALLARATERYGADVPTGVGVLVAAVDVQADRLEWKVKGYGAGEESWLIGWGQIALNPEDPRAWHELDQVLLQDWTHASGQRMRVLCTAIDSNFKSDSVYRFCRARLERRVFAVRGGHAVGQPLVGRPTVNNAYRARLFTLCVDTGKETVHARLRIGTPGPGFMHLPEWVDAEYVAQITAEKAFRKFVRGRGYTRVWEKVRDRNEAFDLEVYCLAALKILGEPFIRTLGARAVRYATPVLPLGAEGEDTGSLEAKDPSMESIAVESASKSSKARASHGTRPRRNWATDGKGWKI